MPIVRSIGYLWPIIRSISYLRLCTLEVCLIPKFRLGRCLWPSPLISNEIYRCQIMISKVIRNKLSYVKSYVRIPVGSKREYFIRDGFRSQP